MTLHHARPQVDLGADAQAHPDANELGDSAFRVLILGDFGGASARRQPLAQRVLHRIDRDGIDAALAAIAPRMAFAIDDDAPEIVAFGELDDFHPDRLLANVPMLARLRELRTTIESRPELARSQSRRMTTADESDTRSLLDRMLDAEPPLPAGPSPAPPQSGDELSDFVRRAVRPHVAREVDPQQRAVVAQVDEVLGATLRVLLHDPAFQALESIWRAADVFLRRCDAGESTQIGVLDLARTELAALGADAAATAELTQRLSTGADGSWSVVIAAYEFSPADIELLSAIATVAQATQVPWIAAADARLIGAPTFADNGDADDWEHATIPGWDELRRAPAARYLGLALPRFLVRLPYGAQNPVESMTFEELLPGTRAHESFLWGNGAFLCALVGSIPVERGKIAPTHGTIGGLPLHLDASRGATEGLPCAEVVLSQRTMMHILGRGLTPLASERDGDVIRIPRLQSIAEPPAALPIRPAVRD